MDVQVKLWEEPDRQLLTDDVRGGLPLLLGGVATRRRAHPSIVPENRQA